jgi:hypothetical protein
LPEQIGPVTRRLVPLKGAQELSLRFGMQSLSRLDCDHEPVSDHHVQPLVLFEWTTG